MHTNMLVISFHLIDLKNLILYQEHVFLAQMLNHRLRLHRKHVKDMMRESYQRRLIGDFLEDMPTQNLKEDIVIKQDIHQQLIQM